MHSPGCPFELYRLSSLDLELQVISCTMAKEPHKVTVVKQFLMKIPPLFSGFTTTLRYTKHR